MFKKTIYRLFFTITLLFSACRGVSALQADVNRALTFGSSAVSHTPYSSLGHSSLSSLGQYAQNTRVALRSRSEVVDEVKRRYNAEVLKISLDDRQQVYRVRVLMGNGKVRNLKINARR